MADGVRFFYGFENPARIELRNDAMTVARGWKAEVVDPESREVLDMIDAGDLAPGEERTVSARTDRPFVLKPVRPTHETKAMA